MLYLLAVGVLLLAGLNIYATTRLLAHLSVVAAASRDETAQARREFLEHIEKLYQRIQAPQAAVVEHHAQASGPSWPAVAIDDDEGFFAAQEVSKERLAELALEQELRDRKPDLAPVA